MTERIERPSVVCFSICIGLHRPKTSPFTLFLLVVSIVLHSQMGRDRGSLASIMGSNAFLMGSGILMMLGWLYVPLFTNGMLALPDQGSLALREISGQVREIAAPQAGSVF